VGAHVIASGIARHPLDLAHAGAWRDGLAYVLGQEDDA
jgi:hypothetical protein